MKPNQIRKAMMAQLKIDIESNVHFELGDSRTPNKNRDILTNDRGHVVICNAGSPNVKSEPKGGLETALNLNRKIDYVRYIRPVQFIIQVGYQSVDSLQDAHDELIESVIDSLTAFRPSGCLLPMILVSVTPAEVRKETQLWVKIRVENYLMFNISKIKEQQ